MQKLLHCRPERMWSHIAKRVLYRQLSVQINTMKKLTLFYDGQCPLCKAEIQFLSVRNQAGLLGFVDINSDQYKPEIVGLSVDEALASMSAQYEDGKTIIGVEVFSEAYVRANLMSLAWIFSRPTLMPFWQAFYRFFAKNRHAISAVLGPPALHLVGLYAPKATKIGESNSSCGS